MGRSVEIIGASSFRKCTKLKSIVLPKSIDELGKNAFYGCKKLKSITIQANSVVDIADNAIKGISKKAIIKVPKKLIKGYKKQLGKKTGYKKTNLVSFQNHQMCILYRTMSLPLVPKKSSRLYK